MTCARRIAIVAVSMLGLAGCGSATAPELAVVASGLANPRQMSFGPDGALYVAEAGTGGRTRCVKEPGKGGQRICLGGSGSIVRIADGATRRVITGLPSVAGLDGTESSGPADVAVSGGRIVFVTQDTEIDRTGANQFGREGEDLGHLLSAPAAGGAAGALRVGANFARFEAEHNPDRGAGAAAGEAGDSDPYGLTPFRGGYAVADAAGNDLLWVDSAGLIHVLAVFPIQYETAPAGVAGRLPRRMAVQAVPTSVAVGPDGTLYVSELSGFPFQPGFARIWRVLPGRAPTVYAGGFTNISSIAFDRRGRLLVLEINRAGLRNATAPGELIRLEGGSRRTVLASAGLASPTGVAVAPDDSIYVSNNGTSPGSGQGPHGEILRLSPG